MYTIEQQLADPLKHLGLLLNEEYGLYIMAEPFTAVITYIDGEFYVETYLFDGYELASEGYTEEEITAYILANTQHPFFLVSCENSYSWSIVDSPLKGDE